jgi:hypothetical protein
MKIQDFLAEMEPAIRYVVTEVHRERAETERLRAEIEPLDRATIDGYQRAEWLAMNPDLDDEGLGTAIYWDTYFGADKERYHKQRELSEAEARIAAHEFSTAALAGTLLQFAKQGIALRYAKTRKTTAPDGRLVAGMPLHEIIWQARNQALHWEDGTFHPPTEQCFQQLATIDPAFAQFKTRSLAFETIALLGWTTFEAVRDDLLLLDP